MAGSAFFISSYNIRGLSSNNVSVVNGIIDNYKEDNIVMGIQEHFQMRKNLRKLHNSFPNMSVLAKAAFKPDSIINNSRPRGGLAILIPKFLRSSIGLINNRSWRIQSITMVVGTIKYLVINLYLPCDLRRSNDKCEELLETLAEVGETIDNNKHDVLLNLGDLNTDISRVTKYVDYVKDFWEKRNLGSVCGNVDYTCGDNVIDHFVMYNHQSDMISEVTAKHIV